ncbi:biotin-dependent carboxyltransferase family protein [Martelella limonii]|uniref:5-oxoprolinase subunit C family protein n=1 Tax=Martelella limonii TaxID=1647649 RepID=UPI0015803207|nr:biotin-dependent carboxyltransferase family protein [Martelella limonii]
MNALEVIRAGLMVSVQAKPRTGYMAAGVSPSGPMDEAAFRIAQALVGNDGDAAALEFAQFGGRYRVTEACMVAVTGGAAALAINGRPMPLWESHAVRPGEVIDIGPMRGAVWGYIAFSGGIAVPALLGSRATHVRNGMGGFEGRVLADGDILPLGESAPGPVHRLSGIFHRPHGPIRIVAGPQAERFDRYAWSQLLGEAFAVSPRRDRMASLLDGPLLRTTGGHDIISDATPAGSIQVPGSGIATVLMAERQTTGGYPKIATVISSDLGRLAQMPAGAPFHFVAITQDEAEMRLLAERERIETAIRSIATPA